MTTAVLEIADLPCDDASQRRLLELAANPPAGALLIIEAPGDLARHAAEAYARHAVGPHRNDLRLAVPEADRWTVAEVEELIIRPATLMPDRRNVIVVADADQMAVGAAEHLLKTLEEPPSRTLFVFAVANVDLLLATIVGRAAVTVRIEPSSPQNRRAALVAAGLDVDTALEVVELTGTLTGLASAAGKNHDLVPMIRDALGAPLVNSDPASAAHRAAAALETLAAAIDPEAGPAGDDVEAPAKRSRKPADALVKARTRVLVRALLNRWRAVVVAALAAENLDHVKFARITSTLEAIDIAETSLGVYVPVPAVLAPVLHTAAR